MSRFNPDDDSELVLRVRDDGQFRGWHDSPFRYRVQDYRDGIVHFRLMLLRDCEGPPVPPSPPAYYPDRLVEMLRDNLPEGWGKPGDPYAGLIRIGVLRAWLAGHPMEDLEVQTSTARRFLDADLPAEWVPASADDPLFQQLWEG